MTAPEMVQAETILVASPSPLAGRVTRIEHHILRGVLVLEYARQPRTAEELHINLNIPIASIYRILRALMKLGWIRHAGSRVVAGAHGFGPAKLFVATSPRLPVFPHPCGDCHMTIYSPEHEGLHSCH